MTAPAPAAGGEPALQLQGITKRFGATVALDAVDLRVEPGTIHALVGENGAGKSTLAHVAAGLLVPDAGAVHIAGTRLQSGDALSAQRLGLGLVQQHFALVPTLTAAENVALGQEPRRGPWLDRAAMARTLQDTARTLGFHLDPGARAGQLSVGDRQRLEIVKALARGARTLVLDEPTAVLAPQEVVDLFATLRAWVKQGHTLVLVTHRLSEVLALAGTVTVLRAGRVVTTMQAAGATESDLARAIVGRPLRPPVRRPAAPGDVVLAVRDVATREARDAARGVSLEVRAGEVLGLAGVDGNGQRALARAVVGLEPLVKGRVELRGADVTHQGVAARRARGLAYVSDDRHAEGLVRDFDLAENLALGPPDRNLQHGPWLDPRAQAARAATLLTNYDVRPPDPRRPARALSGGNQQKLVLARELSRAPRLVVLAQPTRGVDVGGAEALHARILAARDAGAAVLLVSSDLDEILALSDRIAVLYAGRIRAIFARDHVDLQRLGLAMLGAEG